MMPRIEKVTTNPGLKSWYPIDLNPDMLKPLEQSPYGPPNSETLHVFAALLPLGSKIGDIGGGEARYALPLARMGYHVITTDVDAWPLLRARKKSRLDGVVGKIETRLSDATEGLSILDGSLDGVLNAGFAYLMPPKLLREHVGEMTKTLVPGGVMVIEFATNRVRREKVDSEDSSFGENEHQYTHYEGMALMKELFSINGFRHVRMQEKVIHFEEPYYLHNDLIIASGIRN